LNFFLNECILWKNVTSSISSLLIPVQNAAHVFYIGILILAGALTTVVFAVRGCNYYLTPLSERPFHAQYNELKPSGSLGHGYGIVGSLMITAGVVIYSSRKRIHAFANFGKIKSHLEFHMFLCLVGPILVLYHTTFKFGGLVAVSFWSMAAVVLSGIFGRYVYVQIPRGIHGNELTMDELEKENGRIRTMLELEFQLDRKLIDKIDSIASTPVPVSRMSTLQVLRFFAVGSVTRRLKLEGIYHEMRKNNAFHSVAGKVRDVVQQRIVLTRRIAYLEKMKQIFHYWHVVHLPFSLIMFFILLVHVAVTVAFGYTWIF
jgi:hypothetical protein